MSSQCFPSSIVCVPASAHRFGSSSTPHASFRGDRFLLINVTSVAPAHSFYSAFRFDRFLPPVAFPATFLTAPLTLPMAAAATLDALHDRRVVRFLPRVSALGVAVTQSSLFVEIRTWRCAPTPLAHVHVACFAHSPTTVFSQSCPQV